jgi:excisionase family DNA binding protein
MRPLRNALRSCGMRSGNSPEFGRFRRPVFLDFIPPGGRLALRINDAVAASGLSRSTLYKLMSEGKLTAVKVAGRRLILIEDLHGLLRRGYDMTPGRQSSAIANSEHSTIEQTRPTRDLSKRDVHND